MLSRRLQCIKKSLLDYHIWPTVRESKHWQRMQQNKGQTITVSLRWCNKATYHRAKVSDYKMRFASKWKILLCFMELWTETEHGKGSHKELNSNTERRVCMKEMAGLSGVQTKRRLLAGRRAREGCRDCFQIMWQAGLYCHTPVAIAVVYNVLRQRTTSR